ncbi:MAG: orotidine-5'-phosphate decarboxylase [Dehalococcoidia bacterium]|nr:orotidine-5'-phosphate decarboxylase [Dehalococcoidia bacterium]
MNFINKYQNIVEKNHSFLCIGLDIHDELMPSQFTSIDFLKNIIDSTKDLVCAYKPNVAFFEKHGPEGITLLKNIIDYIPSNIPIILDAKRGDIGSTAKAYADAAFNFFNADAITLNPYFGIDSIKPFIDFQDKHIFILCRTTNQSSNEVQSLKLKDGSSLFKEVAFLSNQWNHNNNIGLVVGGTFVDEAKEIRSISPEMIFLVPGIGSQGADTKKIVNALKVSDSKPQIIISASRSIIFAGEQNSTSIADYMGDVRNEAITLKNEINHYLN